MRRELLAVSLVLTGACAPVLQEPSFIANGPSTLLGELNNPTVKTVVRVTEEPMGHPVAFAASGAKCELHGRLAAKWWNIEPGMKLSCAWR